MNNNSCGYPLQRQAGNIYCECECSSTLPEFPVCTALAMAYVPFQGIITDSYSCDKALMRGTLFPCLDKPFMMGCCK